jgi:hypothetical protein
MHHWRTTGGYNRAMQSTFILWLRHLSRICGFDTADAFPPGHPHAQTRWNGAYFDIASDVKPEQIERRLCAAIANTPAVFSHIINPTPRMQRALLGVLDERMRGNGNPGDLVALLITAHASATIVEALPGLHAAINDSDGWPMAEREAAVLAFLLQMTAPFDVIDMPA